MAGIAAAGLTKRFGGTEVIRAIDLTVADREFCVLVGPSGCGKSTLLRMIAGLETIDDGELSIGETVVNGVAPKDRGVSMVFQSYALYPHMTVYRNMAFGLERARMSKSDIRARVTRAADILQIEALLDRKPRALSGGQRQRVAIGRAIVRDPKVFLFDEPLSNLDAALRVQMRLELRHLHGRLDATVIHVTHDQVEAMTLADRIVVMRDGRIEQAGAPRDLYTAPANTFVAQFIGSPAMSLLPGELRDGAAWVGGVAFGAAPGADQPVQIGVRPEHFALGGPDAAGLRFRVDLVEDLGESRFIHGAVGETRLTVRAPGEGPKIAIGDRLTARPDPQKLHLFDALGARIGAA